MSGAFRPNICSEATLTGSAYRMVHDTPRGVGWGGVACNAGLLAVPGVLQHPGYSRVTRRYMRRPGPHTMHRTSPGRGGCPQRHGSARDQPRRQPKHPVRRAVATGPTGHSPRSDHAHRRSGGRAWTTATCARWCGRGPGCACGAACTSTATSGPRQTRYRDQPLLRVRAAQLVLRCSGYVFSHDSAAIAHGLGVPRPGPRPGPRHPAQGPRRRRPSRHQAPPRAVRRPPGHDGRRPAGPRSGPDGPRHGTRARPGGGGGVLRRSAAKRRYPSRPAARAREQMWCWPEQPGHGCRDRDGRPRRRVMAGVRGPGPGHWTGHRPAGDAVRPHRRAPHGVVRPPRRPPRVRGRRPPEVRARQPQRARPARGAVARRSSARTSSAASSSGSPGSPTTTATPAAARPNAACSASTPRPATGVCGDEHPRPCDRRTSCVRTAALAAFDVSSP